MKTFKSAMKDVSLKAIYNSIVNFDGSTPEEVETIIDCKNYIRYRTYEGWLLCVGATSLLSCIELYASQLRIADT